MSEVIQPPSPFEVNEPELARLCGHCSNIGRWGVDDERGTLNLITAATRIAAANLVRNGRCVPLGHDLETVRPGEKPSPAVHRMLDSQLMPWATFDSIEIAPHGFRVTHLDALAHVFLNGRTWNGRLASEVVRPAGLRFGSIRALKDGVFTRGVLLDVARARGVDWLLDTEAVTPADLDRAEEFAGTEVGSGDAIVVRVGLAAREAVLGEEDPSRRAGLTPACLAWIKDRDVAVYSGDCIEQRPSPYPAYPLPVHMIGMAAMGLIFLDNIDVEPLSVACAELARWTFLLTCAPVVLDGATGSAVNPLALF